MSLICKAYQGSSGAFIRRFHASSALRENNFDRFLFKLEGLYKYGLLKDDILNERNWEVSEAVRRLPEEEQMQRLYRAIRAQQAEINHSVLPEDQWTKFEDNHHYLQPYLKEILKEKEEMQEWEANH